MMPGILYAPKTASRDDGPAAFRAPDWLSLAATPTFAVMAALTGIFGGGADEMLCSAASHMSGLSGMVPMYVLMSAFHLAPWLKVVSRWRAAPARREPAIANRRN